MKIVSTQISDEKNEILKRLSEERKVKRAVILREVLENNLK